LDPNGRSAASGLRTIREPDAADQLSGFVDRVYTGAPEHMQTLPPLNLAAWVDEHRHLLKPPVGNKLIYRDSEFIVMAVGGPNARRDFHVDPGEEFFHQLEGTMTLRLYEGGAIRDVPIRAGEILLLPALVPHSPQRPAGSVGLVIERQRRAGELDGLQWYCENCHQLLYQERLTLTNIETQFPPVFDRFFGSLAHRTCRHCGTVCPPPATDRR
jgi:3-hydroxyanthranilate 3,4-dioxygenase